MTPTAGDLVKLCAQIYQPNAAVSGFDYFDAGMDDGVCWAIKRLDGCDVVVFRGSVTMQDWARDILALALPSRIGHVHTGFYAGMEHMWSDCQKMVTQPVAVTGHSLGAARADVMAAMMSTDGQDPVLRVVFGEPKPGLIDFTSRIARIPGGSYRNGDGFHHDLITDVPFSFPPEEYVRPTPIIRVCAAPPADDRWGAFSWHHIELYEAAIAAAETKAADPQRLN
ncbi:lipase family protein [Bradyrhizobium sp. Tv2a-2]|uniref:lipase family protein n=1 Tax=Bradyrhizobium sp. Tv2a-2 TaxID=113395 RepID=UPI00040A6ECC|nr:lipase family protein [Bradyrhizobium sp. Tv2a-2]